MAFSKCRYLFYKMRSILGSITVAELALTLGMSMYTMEDQALYSVSSQILVLQK
jgi:hypothetical protein